MRILLVDNDPVYAGLLAEVLSLYSHQVVRTRDGESALRLLKKDPVDLVISDALMPRMSGFMLHARMRSDAQLKHTPFALNSAHKHLLNILSDADPSVDFKFDKTMSLPSLLYLINHMDAEQRTRNAPRYSDSILGKRH